METACNCSIRAGKARTNCTCSDDGERKEKKHFHSLRTELLGGDAVDKKHPLSTTLLFDFLCPHLVELWRCLIRRMRRRRWKKKKRPRLRRNLKSHYLIYLLYRLTIQALIVDVHRAKLDSVQLDVLAGTASPWALACMMQCLVKAVHRVAVAGATLLSTRWLSVNTICTKCTTSKLVTILLPLMKRKGYFCHSMAARVFIYSHAKWSQSIGHSSKHIEGGPKKLQHQHCHRIQFYLCHLVSITQWTTPCEATES